MTSSWCLLLQLILRSVNFYFEYRALYEILWKNIVQPDRPLKTIWRTAKLDT